MSYGGDPANSPSDAVRLLLGDTDNNDLDFTDAEIAWALATYGSAIMAAARLARGLAAKFAKQVDKAVGDLRISLSDRFKHFSDLADQLEDQATRGGDLKPAFFVGGTSIDDKQTREDDPDRPRPSFERGKFDSGREQKSGNSDDPRWFYPGGR